MTKEDADRIRNIPMLFILGQGRSGTTLLQNLLNSHIAIIAPPLESKFIVLLYPRFAHIKKWTESDIVNFAESLYIDPLFASVWNVDKTNLTAKLLAVKEYADYSLLCKMVYHQTKGDKENVSLISVINPDNTLFINTLLKIFPDAKFIHIIREPRDNVYSHISSFHTRNTIFIAYKWLGYNKVVEKAKLRLPERFYTVLYEKIVEKTEETMKALCKFMQVLYSDRMTENTFPEKLSAYLRGTGSKGEEGEIHISLSQPVNSIHIGKWKSKMSDYDRTVTEIITGDYAKKMYGYDIEVNPAKMVKPPRLKLLTGRVVYYSWQIFKRAKFKSLRFNLLYSKYKKLVKGDELPLWEYF